MTVRARQIKVEAYALAGAVHDPRVPWAARLFAAIAIGYTLSPIDLIPDFIPLIGYLDDLVLVPLFILIARRLIPPDILAEHRQRARSDNHDRSSRAAAVVIVSIWVIVLLVVFVLLWRRLG